MTKTIEERLEEQEEVLQLMLNKLQTLENRKVELPEIQLPDYAPQFNDLKESIDRHNLVYPAKQIEVQILELKNSIAFLPKRIPIQHYYHFTDRSKGSIIAVMILLITCAFSVGIVINLWKENKTLSENSIKFRMIRQAYPKATRWADTTYHQNSAAIERLIDSLELEPGNDLKVQK